MRILSCFCGRKQPNGAQLERLKRLAAEAAAPGDGGVAGGDRGSPLAAPASSRDGAVAAAEDEAAAEAKAAGFFVPPYQVAEAEEVDSINIDVAAKAKAETIKRRAAAVILQSAWRSRQARVAPPPGDGAVASAPVKKIGLAVEVQASQNRKEFDGETVLKTLFEMVIEKYPKYTKRICQIVGEHNLAVPVLALELKPKSVLVLKLASELHLLMCPTTCQLFVTPVTLDGHTFEMDQAVQLLERGANNPVIGTPFNCKKMFNNYVLGNVIKAIMSTVSSEERQEFEIYIRNIKLREAKQSREINKWLEPGREGEEEEEEELVVDWNQDGAPPAVAAEEELVVDWNQDGAPPAVAAEEELVVDWNQDGAPPAVAAEEELVVDWNQDGAPPVLELFVTPVIVDGDTFEMIDAVELLERGADNPVTGKPFKYKKMFRNYIFGNVIDVIMKNVSSEQKQAFEMYKRRIELTEKRKGLKTINQWFSPGNQAPVLAPALAPAGSEVDRVSQDLDQTIFFERDFEMTFDDTYENLITLFEMVKKRYPQCSAKIDQILKSSFLEENALDKFREYVCGADVYYDENGEHSLVGRIIDNLEYEKLILQEQGGYVLETASCWHDVVNLIEERLVAEAEEEELVVDWNQDGVPPFEKG